MRRSSPAKRGSGRRSSRPGYEAVKNALTYEWSNGQLEGQINRVN